MDISQIIRIFLTKGFYEILHEYFFVQNQILLIVHLCISLKKSLKQTFSQLFLYSEIGFWWHFQYFDRFLLRNIFLGKTTMILFIRLLWLYQIIMCNNLKMWSILFIQIFIGTALLGHFLCFFNIKTYIFWRTFFWIKQLWFCSFF